MKELTDTNAILAVLIKDGLTLAEIQERLPIYVERRTLQRRIKNLKDLNQILVSGAGRATRYYPTLEVAFAQERDDDFSDSISLSLASKEVLSLVSRTQRQRKPVGYNRVFLESYRPNLDSYLRPADIDKLDRLGRTQQEHQPAGTYARQILNRLLIDADRFPKPEMGKFIEVVETELMGMHEGNFARYRIAPAEFKKWRGVWKS